MKIKENEDLNWGSSNEVNGSGPLTIITGLSFNLKLISPYFTILIIQDKPCLPRLTTQWFRSQVLDFFSLYSNTFY